MSVVDDIIDGSVSEDTTGITAERIFIVDNIRGNRASRLYNALIANGVPSINENHPTIPDIQAVSKIVEPIGKDPTKARVTVSYKVPDEDEKDDPQGAVIQVGSSTSTTETQKDIHGDQIKVSIVFANGETGTQGGSVAVESPHLVFSFQRKELASPVKKSIAFTGTINKSNAGKFFGKRTLLCRGVEGTSDDGGLTYSVSYAFEYNPLTWLAPVIYKDEETDKPHTDVSVNDFNGFNFFEVYEETDFSSLGLDFEFTGVPDQ